MDHFRDRDIAVPKGEVMIIRDTDANPTEAETSRPFPFGSVVTSPTLRSLFTGAQRRSMRTIRLHYARVWLVQAFSIARLCTTILFVALASTHSSVFLLFCLYAFAIVTDVIDGYLSRRLKAESYLGKVTDLVADKSLTIVSLIYAASRGIDILPVALIASRDIIMIGMRLVTVDGAQLLPTNRTFGGIMAVLVWGNTLFLICAKAEDHLLQVANGIYWTCAMIFLANLLARLYASGPRIKAASMGVRLSDGDIPNYGQKCICTCGLLNQEHRAQSSDGLHKVDSGSSSRLASSRSVPVFSDLLKDN
jgi:phosphatidylglycerophosphate synthase